MEELRIPSFAKINLGLLLLNKRSDGYHDIATIFQQIDLQDTLTFRRSNESVEINVDQYNIPSGESNLIYKAFKRIQEEIGFEGGLYAQVHKQIPPGGGLGGGSSNAAMTLLAVNVLYGLSLSVEKLQEIGTGIGSDVPFFVKGGSAVGLGRGERLETVQLPHDYWIVLLLPDISVSTAWAYNQAKITLTKEEKMATFRALLGNYENNALKDILTNDLEHVVFKRHPQLQLLKMQLYQKDAFYASMSGSGSTVFGLFETEKKAVEAHSFFSKESAIHAKVCRPVNESPASWVQSKDRF